jgi:hypothetical protein
MAAPYFRDRVRLSAAREGSAISVACPIVSDWRFALIPRVKKGLVSVISIEHAIGTLRPANHATCIGGLCLPVDCHPRYL